MKAEDSSLMWTSVMSHATELTVSTAAPHQQLIMQEIKGNLCQAQQYRATFKEAT